MNPLTKVWIPHQFSRDKNPIVFDTNVLIEIGKEGAEYFFSQEEEDSIKERGYIPNSVAGELYGFFRIGRLSGRKKKELETFIDGMTQSGSISRSNNHKFKTSVCRCEDDTTLDRIADEYHTGEGSKKEYLAGLITYAIFKDQKLYENRRKQALGNLYTDAEIVLLTLVSAIEGNNPSVVSDDKDVGRIIYSTYKAARNRSLEIIEREDEVSQQELDILADIECVNMKMYGTWGDYGFDDDEPKLNSIKAIAKKFEPPHLKASRSEHL